MNASQRKAIYAAAAAIGAVAVVFGLITQEEADAVVAAVVAVGGVLPSLAAVLALFKTNDAVAVKDKDGETVAGPDSALPNGSPVDVSEVTPPAGDL